MGTGSYYLEESGFVYNKFTGKLNDETLNKLVNSINDTAGDAVDLRELSDCRELDSIDEMTVEGTISSSKEEVNRPQSLLAILVPPLNQQFYGMAQVYKSFAEGTREDVKIFTDYDEAVSWLAKDDEEKETLKNFIDAFSI